MMADIKLQDPSSTALKNIQPVEEACVRYSTRATWDRKRNVQVDESPPGTLVYSYQDQTGEEIKTRVEEDWKVLGRGRDGKLLSWQHETPYGISDTAGKSCFLFLEGSAQILKGDLLQCCYELF